MQTIGFSQLKTNVPGGRQANIWTMRASLIDVSCGAVSRLLAEDLAVDAHTSTQFAGWSPDGATAIIGQFHKSPELAAEEESRKTFLHDREGTLYDTWLVDLATGDRRNVTAVDRISLYNAGLKYWPGDPSKLTFQALIHGRGHPATMNLDGSGKKDLLEGQKGFSYGAVPSPDGKILVHQTEYKIHMESDGERKQIDTGFHFNFGPTWTPDSKWFSVIAGANGETADHVLLISRDGGTVREIADRGGYCGVIEFLDVPDYHSGSSDIPVWAPDGSCLYLTRKVGETHDIWRAGLDGGLTRLTASGPGTLNYHPAPSPDGTLVCFGSNRSGTRQLWIMNPDGSESYQLTHAPEHSAAMWPWWRPAISSLPNSSGSQK